MKKCLSLIQQLPEEMQARFLELTEQAIEGGAPQAQAQAQAARAMLREAEGALDEPAVDAQEQSESIPATGEPVTLYYGRNTEPSGKFKLPDGMDVGRDIEPAGEYMNVERRPMSAPDERWEVGTISFKNPLVLEHSGTGSNGWKRELSEMFGGKKGKALSAAVRAAGHDAIITHDSYGLNETVNLGGTKGSGTIQASRKNKPGQFALAAFGKWGQFVERFQDAHNRWKQAVAQVKAQGGKITEANDFYRALERYYGAVASLNDDFEGDVSKFIDAIAADGLTLEQVSEYAYALHAEERNDHIAKQRAAMPDGGSGMETADAQAIIAAAAQAGTKAALDRHAATMQGFIQGTRDTLYNGGLIGDGEYQAWSGMFKHYVPLRGLDDVPEKRGTGAGFNVKGAEGKTAMGRKSRAKQIMEQIVQDRIRANIRVGKNEVLRSFLSFVLDNPSPNLWEVNALESKPTTTVDANGNRIIDEGTIVIGDDRTVTVKDGGEEIKILIVDDDLRAQFQNLNAEKLGKIVGALQWANRKIGAMMTAFSPTFIVLNGARDFTAASFGIIDELGLMGAPRLWAAMPGAARDAYRAQRGRPSALYRQYKATGGTTGYFSLGNLDEEGDKLQAMLRNADRPGYDPRKAWGVFLKVVEGANAVVEQTTRFAAYKAAIESGETPARAASVSKNITVNFNRKGTSASVIGAFVLFFNPAVQGTARLAQALKSPQVLSVLGAAMTGIFALALRNASMGDDDDEVAWWDKIPKEVKERNLIVILPHGAKTGEAIPDTKIGRYVKIPIPYGWNTFAVMANEAADQWRRSNDPKRGRAPIESVARVAGAVVNTLQPFDEAGKSIEGDTKSLILLAWPDSLDPPMQNLMNRSGFGRQLYPETQQNEKLPDSLKYTPSQAGTIFQRGAEALNKATGGTKYEGGAIDLSPGSLENLIRGYGGGPVSFSLDLVNAIYARTQIKREDMDSRRLPFVKQLFGVIDEETDRVFSSDIMEKSRSASQPFEAALDAGDREAALQLRAKLGDIVATGSVTASVQRDLAGLRKDMMKILASDQFSESEKYSRMVALGVHQRVLQQKYTKAMMDLQEKQKQ